MPKNIHTYIQRHREISKLISHIERIRHNYIEAYGSMVHAELIRQFDELRQEAVTLYDSLSDDYDID